MAFRYTYIRATPCSKGNIENWFSLHPAQISVERQFDSKVSAQWQRTMSDLYRNCFETQTSEYQTKCGKN